ncbi:MAG: hypothetical protein WB681_10180 [Candidatus Cybelea sp.]
MTGLSALLIAHVVLTTAGYVGLIATNLVVLVLCARQDAALMIEAVFAWRRAARVFGPTLGIGVLLGLWLVGVTHVGFAALWLLVTYGFIIVALGAQAAIMIPWQLRAQRASAEGASVSGRPIILVLSVFAVAYMSIISLMILKPG